MRPAIRPPVELLDEHALSARSFLLLVPISTVGVLTIVPGGTGTAGAELLVIASTLAALAMAAGMAVAAWLRARLSSAWQARSFTLAAALAVGAARGLVVGATFDLLGLADRASLGARALSSGLIFGLWIVLVGALVSALARHRRTREALIDEVVTRELQVRLLDGSRLRGTHEGEHRRLEPVFEDVRAALDDPGTGYARQYERMAAQVQAVLDERLRPLVHEMWSAPLPRVGHGRSTAAFARIAILARVPIGWVLPALGIIVAASSLMSVQPRVALTAALAVVAATAVLLLLERRLSPSPTVRSRAALALGLLVLPFGAAWALTAQEKGGLVSTWALMSLLATPLVVVAVACAARAIIGDHGGECAALERRLASGQWDDQLRVLEQRIAQSTVASQVHNTVQARLTAAALQLRTASLVGDHDRAAQAIREARSALDSVGDEAAPDQVAPTERLAAVVEAWRGIVDIRVVCDPGVVDCANAHVALDSVEECIANASRHAAASIVTVRMSIDGGDIVIAVCDNGHPVQSDSRPGLGTAWMRAVSEGRFRRHRTNDGWNVVELSVRMG